MSLPTQHSLVSWLTTYINDDDNFGVRDKDDLGHSPLSQHAQDVPSLSLNRYCDSVRVHL